MGKNASILNRLFRGKASGQRPSLGAGPKWALPTTIYFIAAVTVHVATYPQFVISSMPFSVCAIAGAVLVAAGICTYIVALSSLRQGLRRGVLVTDGLYSIVRHPLYASSLLLIIPGVAIASRSWLLLGLPVVAVAAFWLFIAGEEDILLQHYGEEFERYRARTNAIFPTLRRKRN